jgi:hypothetical protein
LGITISSHEEEILQHLQTITKNDSADGKTCGKSGIPEPELNRLSSILKVFNDLFGNIDWKDADKICKVIAEEIPAKVSADRAY